MKRFDVTNTANGMTFSVQGESLDAIYSGTLPLEWGKPERELTEDELRAEGKTLASAKGMRAEGTPGPAGPVIYYKVQADYEITETDLAPEIEAREKKHKKRKDARDRVKRIKWSDVTTIAELKSIVRDLIEREEQED